MKRLCARFALALTALSLASCGGGGGGGGSDSGGSSVGQGNGSGTPAPSQFAPSSSYAQQCAPMNGLADASLRTGSLDTEKKWLRSYMDEAYLWYDQVPAVNAAAAQYSDTLNPESSVAQYFYALLTPQRTASGNYLDRFSYAISTADWNARLGQGTEVSYGVIWSVSYEPNTAVVAWVAPGSQAAQAGLQRGDNLASLDGAALSALDQRTFVNGVFPASAGSAHRLTFTRGGVSGPDVTLSPSALTLPSVPIVQTISTPSGPVGYLLFNSHDAPSEASLIAAVNQLKSAGVNDLVLDLRYNLGGYLYVASELAYMIAGPQRTAGRTFEKLSYNAKRTADNAQAPFPFLNGSCILDAASGNCTNQQPLPTLNLGRVYVLASDSTCSASEAVINGLRGVDVDVHIVGGTTCGKPYGFGGQDNCGITYLPIEFKGTNAKGFGDYADGFAPTCAVDDDFAHALGSTGEGQLAAALAYRQSGTCVAQASSGTSRRMSAGGHASATAARSPLRGLRVVGVGPR